jgi:dihydrofolate synthase / folylpolyglutamate synthase
VLGRLYRLEAFGIKLGLENIEHLTAALGHPERQFRSLHVAGTNGKGSVTSMVHAGLRAAGVHAARYTSPHLAHITERFVIGDSAVTLADFETVASDVLDTADRLQATRVLRAAPTFFEATTAIGFELFRRAKVDVAVIEVGLGGRFDATNVVAPMAAAITTIGFDHQQYLGDTLADIAFEKAGIIKNGMTVVAGPLPSDAMAVVRRACSERHARLVETSTLDVRTETVAGHARLSLRTASASYGPVTLALRGAHQIGNAVVAATLLEAAAEAGVPVTADHVARGLAGASWPARLELLRLDGGKHVLLDAAHNIDGAAALAAYLRDSHATAQPCLVVGIMRDKNVDGILRALLPAASRVVVTAAGSARGVRAAELAVRVSSVVRDLGLTHPPPLVVSDPREALDAALGLSDHVCVAGSIFLVGAVRGLLVSRVILR